MFLHVFVILSGGGLCYDITSCVVPCSLQGYGPWGYGPYGYGTSGVVPRGIQYALPSNTDI